MLLCQLGQFGRAALMAKTTCDAFRGLTLVRPQ